MAKEKILKDRVYKLLEAERKLLLKIKLEFNNSLNKKL